MFSDKSELITEFEVEEDNDYDGKTVIVTMSMTNEYGQYTSVNKTFELFGRRDIEEANQLYTEHKYNLTLKLLSTISDERLREALVKNFPPDNPTGRDRMILGVDNA